MLHFLHSLLIHRLFQVKQIWQQLQVWCCSLDGIWWLIFCMLIWFGLQWHFFKVPKLWMDQIFLVFFQGSIFWRNLFRIQWFRFIWRNCQRFLVDLWADLMVRGHYFKWVWFVWNVFLGVLRILMGRRKDHWNQRNAWWIVCSLILDNILIMSYKRIYWI